MPSSPDPDNPPRGSRYIPIVGGFTPDTTKAYPWDEIAAETERLNSGEEHR
jgi:hypothetical protein